MQEEKRTQKPAREPQALSNEYHKARKQLMLWAAILLIWELVGVDLAKAEAMGGNVGAIITAIKSPQAVPWALLILVGYFLFKMTIEWHQCVVPRRQLLVSRIDFLSGWIVSLVAYALYIWQRISHVQFADRVMSSENRFVAAALGMLVGVTIGISVVWAKTQSREGRLMWLLVPTVGFSLTVLVTVSALSFVPQYWGTYAAALLSSFAFAFAVFRRQARWRDAAIEFERSQSGP